MEDAATGTYIDQEFRAWGDKLTPEEEAAVDDYQNGWKYKHLNRALLGQAKEKYVLGGEYGQFRANLDAAVRKGRTKENLIVYRGMETDRVPEAVVNNPAVLIGKELKLGTYMSTSLNKNTSAEFAGMNGFLFRIKVPKGSMAIAPRAIRSNRDPFNHSPYNKENELVLKRSAKLQITKVTKTQYGWTIDATYRKGLGRRP